MALNKSNDMQVYTSDLEIGHPSLGYIKRVPGECMDDEDERYSRWLRKNGHPNARVVCGFIDLNYYERNERCPGTA